MRLSLQQALASQVLQALHTAVHMRLNEAQQRRADRRGARCHLDERAGLRPGDASEMVGGELAGPSRHTTSGHCTVQAQARTGGKGAICFARAAARRVYARREPGAGRTSRMRAPCHTRRAALPATRAECRMLQASPPACLVAGTARAEWNPRLHTQREICDGTACADWHAMPPLRRVVHLTQALAPGGARMDPCPPPPASCAAYRCEPGAGRVFASSFSILGLFPRGCLPDRPPPPGAPLRGPYMKEINQINLDRSHIAQAHTSEGDKIKKSLGARDRPWRTRPLISASASSSEEPAHLSANSMSQAWVAVQSLWSSVQLVDAPNAIIDAFLRTCRPGQQSTGTYRTPKFACE